MYQENCYRKCAINIHLTWSETVFQPTWTSLILKSSCIYDWFRQFDARFLLTLTVHIYHTYSDDWLKAKSCQERIVRLLVVIQHENIKKLHVQWSMYNGEKKKLTYDLFFLWLWSKSVSCKSDTTASSTTTVLFKKRLRLIKKHCTDSSINIIWYVQL